MGSLREVEGCYTGEDVEDVKQKWEAKKHYFEQYKKDGPRPPCIDLDRAILGFNIDNTAAYQAIEDSKALHARRWQTKEGMYRIKRRALPDVRDAPLQDDNAAASCSDGKPRWRSWDGDYAMGYQQSSLMNRTMDTLCFLQEFYIGVRWAASDVSPSSHLAFHIPNTCRVLFVLCCVLGLGCLLLCCVFVSCFASVLESRILRAV